MYVKQTISVMLVEKCCIFSHFYLVLCLQHRDTPENNADTPFEFTPENLKVCKTLVHTSKVCVTLKV